LLAKWVFKFLFEELHQFFPKSAQEEQAWYMLKGGWSVPMKLQELQMKANEPQQIVY
jgi:hypothetical protein